MEWCDEAGYVAAKFSTCYVLYREARQVVVEAWAATIAQHVLFAVAVARAWCQLGKWRMQPIIPQLVSIHAMSTKHGFWHLSADTRPLRMEGGWMQTRSQLCYGGRAAATS